MISIIIPIYNASDFLQETIECILNQTYMDYELILVNDGSTDDSLRIMKKYQQQDDRICIIDKKNSGLSDARNAGYKKSKGEYILFLDHDDIFAPQMLEHMINAITQSDLVYVCAKDATSKQISEWEWNVREYSEVAVPFSGKEIMEKLFSAGEYDGIKGALWGMLIPRNYLIEMESEIYAEQQRLPVTYFEDVHLTYRFFWNAKRVLLLNQIYVVHRVSKQALSRQLAPSAYAYELGIAADLKQKFLKSNLLMDLYYEQLIPFYMTILKTWWQSESYERNLEKKYAINRQICAFAKEYYEDVRKIKCKTIGEQIKKLSIHIFHMSPTIWKMCIGNPWFILKYRLEMR